MSLVVKPTMENSPGVCTLCACTPTEVDGDQKPCIHAEGVDVNWGDDVYICAECVEVICDLWDRPSEEQVSKVRSEIKFLRKQVKRKDQEIAEKDELLRKIREGTKAIKQVKEKKVSS